MPAELREHLRRPLVQWVVHDLAPKPDLGVRSHLRTNVNGPRSRPGESVGCCGAIEYGLDTLAASRAAASGRIPAIGSAMIGIGVIGYGYWGPNLVRNLCETDGAEVVSICDLSATRLDIARRRYSSLTTTSDPGDVILHRLVDVVVIATPISTHFELALRSLWAGKHVLVEKPLAASSDEAKRLVDEAARRRLVLMVDHTFVYTGAVRTIESLIRSGELGTLHYYDSVRINLGLFQHDANVVWDLAVHDLSIMDYVLPSRPKAISAIGVSHLPGQFENLAYLTLFYDNSLISHVQVNWLAPVKLRRTVIGASKKMIVYDDLEPTEKVRVYDSGVTVGGADSVYKMLVDYRVGDISIPQIDRTEALKTEARHLVECITAGCEPLTDGHAGLRVVRILEAATESLRNRGVVVDLACEDDGKRVAPEDVGA